MNITRFPNKAGGLRGINIKANFCQKCDCEKTHGYQFSDVLNSIRLGGEWVTMFICDDCLDEAKKSSK